jgi:hypothetical protein
MWHSCVGDVGFWGGGRGLAESERCYARAVEIVRGVMETECKDLMQRFFRERRKLKFRG